jgi:hypothetical protein
VSVPEVRADEEETPTVNSWLCELFAGRTRGQLAPRTKRLGCAGVQNAQPAWFAVNRKREASSSLLERPLFTEGQLCFEF